MFADKGFSYAENLNVYICQRKNHFQITAQTLVDKVPKYFYAENRFQLIDHYKLNIHAIKSEQKSEFVEIRQSKSTDRKHFKYEPLRIEKLESMKMSSLTAKRLHFGEVTKNNKMLGNNILNPRQRFFKLIVEMQVISNEGQTSLLYSYESEIVIVRVSRHKS